MKLKIGDDFFSWDRPVVMGILNITPDSFYDGGSHNTIDGVLHHCEKLLNDGADIIDIGAFSSRPLGWHTIIIWECQLKPKQNYTTLQALEQTLNKIFLLNNGAKVIRLL